MEILFTSIFLIPLIWMIFLGAIFFLRVQLPERFLSESVKYLSVLMSTLTLGQTALVIHFSSQPMAFDLFDWFSIGEYTFRLRFLVDLVGATYASLTALLIGVIFRFSRNYLHREEGYFRFIFLLSTLMFGLIVVSFARSLDLLFIGWELVGTTSVLLIGYFYRQVQPVRHSIKAIVSYRICDMGILAACAWAHHSLHTTDYQELAAGVAHAHTEHFSLFLIGAFVIWGCLAKSGQFPFCSWLPAAMEGPTPSSAIFYGALSIHLGPFLILRFYHYLEQFPGLLVMIGVIGGISALYATMVGRTRSDAKTMLAYATISQVGLIWVELSLGFTEFALFHMVAHASLRTWQFLRSASLIQDFFENPVVQAEKKIHRNLTLEKIFPAERRHRIYIHALHGFHLDYFTDKVLRGFSWPFRAFIELENRSMNWNNNFVKNLLRKW
jgi:NADH-quinone oxidoreductase subunit L